MKPRGRGPTGADGMEEDSPLPEGVVQELNGGVAHRGLGLSDQPVFVLQRSDVENKMHLKWLYCRGLHLAEEEGGEVALPSRGR